MDSLPRFSLPGLGVKLERGFYNRSATIILMDHHAVAAVSLAGIVLDVLGGLYLAYDLLGGQHGPLRLLTRAVTYSIVFGIGYGLGLGLAFGIAAGLTTGVTIAFELHRTSKQRGHYSLFWESIFSAIRAAGFAVGLWKITGPAYAAAYAVLSTAGQIFAYSRGTRPGQDYSSARKPRFTRRQLWGTLRRTIGQIAAALLCSALIQPLGHPWLFALRLGLVTGLVTGFGSAVNPLIEYYADHLAERRLGAFGICLVLCGFLLQSVQYLAVILDVPLQ